MHWRHMFGLRTRGNPYWQLAVERFGPICWTPESQLTDCI